MTHSLASRFAPSPNFVGGGVLPMLTRSVDGLNSTQAGGASPPTEAIATDLGYVMEGTQGAFAIYRASTGALAFGPYAVGSFFTPQPTDYFRQPQLYYDVMFDRWIIAWLELTPGNPYPTHSYFDIAISRSNSPTQPNPASQYFIYQIPTNINGGSDWCQSLALGVEYYSLTIGCWMMDSAGVVAGNALFSIDKGPLRSGGTASMWAWMNAVPSSVGVCDGLCPAFQPSPAIEEGVQDGEFVVATDYRQGIPTSNLTVCALTNLPNIVTTQPTLTCTLNDLGVTYADPIPAAQPGTANTIQAGLGMKQVYYKTGRLFIAFTSTFSGPGDGVVWAEVEPRLQPRSQHNLQWVDFATIIQASSWFAGANTYAFEPTFMGSDEDDLALFFSYSNSANTYSSLAYTGRKLSDALTTMGQGGSWTIVVSGAHTAQGGDASSACAIALNSVTRGTLWCASDYPGSVPDPGWNTRLISLRVE